MPFQLDENARIVTQTADEASVATASLAGQKWDWSIRSRRYLAEAIGIFIIVFAAGGVNITSSPPWGGQAGLLGAALASGLAVMAMIYTLGHICGAHFNPAVTLAFTIVRRFPRREVPGYILSQLGGASLAAYCLKFLFGDAVRLGVTQPHPAATSLQALFLEFILSFFLMFVVMAVATDSRAVGQAAAIALAATVMVAVLVGGPVSGASMNPARSFGPAIAAQSWQEHWVYWLGPIGGAIGGALIYQFIRGSNSDDKAEKERSYRHER